MRMRVRVATLQGDLRSWQRGDAEYGPQSESGLTSRHQEEGQGHRQEAHHVCEPMH